MPTNTQTKRANDQLSLQKKQTNRQYLCLPNNLSYWLSDFSKGLKKHYSLHSNSPIFWLLVAKITEGHYIFMIKSQKCYTWLKIPRILSFRGSMLYQDSKSYARQWYSDRQELPSKPVTDIEWGSMGYQSHYFCHWL